MAVKDYIILALAAACAILYFTRGCGSRGLGIDCPEPKVIEKIVTVEGETEKRKPISEPRETVDPMPIIRPILVATYQERPIYIAPTDTATMVSDWNVKREYSEDVSDTNITATINATIQYNRLQDFSLQYEFEKEHNTLYDRFQFHTLGSFGMQTDFDQVSRVKLGAGALMEFKTGTGAGILYDHTFGRPEPHSVQLMVTQRISFRKRRKQ
jgi:hypothetical protein